MTASPVLDVLEEIIASAVGPAAAHVDAAGTFPRAAVTAFGELGDAASVVWRLVRSTP